MLLLGQLTWRSPSCDDKPDWIESPAYLHHDAESNRTHQAPLMSGTGSSSAHQGAAAERLPELLGPANEDGVLEDDFIEDNYWQGKHGLTEREDY